MTNLKDVFGFNEYCGPGVISIITGVSTDRAAAVISSVTGKKIIKGVQISALLESFNRLGYAQNKIPLYNSLLAGVLSQLAKQDGIYMVSVKDHVVAVEIVKGEVWFCDNHSKQPINAAASARLTQRVEAVYHIVPRLPVPAPAPLIPPVKKIEAPAPEPIHKTYTVEMHEFDFQVFAVLHYESGAVVPVSHGTIRFKNQSEFSSIVNAIMEAFEGGDKA